MANQVDGIEELNRKRTALLQTISLLEPIYQGKKLSREGTRAMNRKLFTIIKDAIPKTRRRKYVLKTIPEIIPKATRKLCTAVVADIGNISEQHLEQIKDIICSFALKATKREDARRKIKPSGEQYCRKKSGRTRRVA